VGGGGGGGRGGGVAQLQAVFNTLRQNTHPAAPWCSHALLPFRSDAYHVVALAGIEEQDEMQALDKAKFERAPREAMVHALAFMRDMAGAVPAYLDRCGAGGGCLEQREGAFVHVVGRAAPQCRAAPDF